MAHKPHKLFERWMWNYMPVTTEGCGCMVLFSLFFVIVFIFAGFLSQFTGDAAAGVLAAIVLIPAVIAFLRFADRHS